MPPEIFEWLENSPLAVYIRQSTLLFPVVEIFHITGFVFLTGCAFMFDLRLLGISKNIAVSDLARHLLTWSKRSLIIVVPSGILLFITQATALSTNSVFWIKLLLILLAFINAGFFHFYIFRSVDAWDRHSVSPIAAKAAALLSMSLWISVIACGRLISYF